MKLLLTLSILLGLSYTLFAQTAEEKVLQKTNVKALKDLSKRFEKEATTQKAIATKKAKEEGWVIQEDYKDGKRIELMALDQFGLPMYLQTHNRSAGVSTNTNVLHNSGSLGYDLEGQGMIIGEWDAGALRLNHIETIGRVTQVDGATTTHDHAQHVGGTMIASGINPSAKGMAPQAQLWAHNWGNDAGEMAAAAANGLLISQHSYGWITGWNYNSNDEDWYWYGNLAINHREDHNFGRYTSRAENWDLIAYNAPYYLICKSAGNDRGDTYGGNHFVRDTLTGAWVTTQNQKDIDGGYLGYDCIGHNGNSKNILTIGATADVPNYLSPASVQITSFSSWGPTDDGRIKPDLVGNGLYVYSTSHDSDSAYSTKSGTSMSGPNVAGSLLLIQQRNRDVHNQYLLAATLKALAIHTCREAGANVGPDYIYGWGLLNTAAAVQLIDDENATIIETTLNPNQSYQKKFYHDGQSDIRATICWTDLPGITPADILDNPQAMLVNDLDVRITDPQGNIFYPYILDPANPSHAATRGDNFRDNVEQIFQQNTAQGYYTLEVTHKGNLINPQDFSLILEGTTAPPPVCLHLDSLWSESAAAVLAQGHEITADSLGNFYVAGAYNGILNVGSFSLNSGGNDELFLAKYDANKTALWLKKITGHSNNKITKITTDQNLNCYLIGNYTNNIDIQGTSFSNGNNLPRGFITKLDANGNLTWAKEIGGNTSNFLTGLVVNNNSIYTSGFFDGNISINTQNLTNFGTGTDSYIANFDANGNLIWAKQMGGAANDALHTLAIDNQQKLWTGGHYEATGIYGNDTLFAFNQNAILVSLSNTGTVLSTKEIRGDNQETIQQVLIDDKDNLYVTANYSTNISINQQTSQSYAGEDIAIIQYDLLGNYKWQTHLHSTGNVALGKMAYLDQHLYIPTQYADSLWLGDTIHISTNPQAGLLVVNQLGYINQFLSFGSNGSDAAMSAASNQNNIYLTGYAANNFSLDNQTATADNEDMWLAIWEYDAIPFIDLGLDKVVQCVDTIQLAASMTGGNSFVWSPTTGLSDSTILNPNFIIYQNTSYQLSTQNACGQKAIDNIIVSIDDTAGYQLIMPIDTTINCGDSLELFPIATGNGLLTYRWTPFHGFSDPYQLNAKVSPQLPSLGYRLTMTNECNNTIIGDIRINTTPPTISATISPDTSISCGDSILLQATASGATNINFNWVPNTGLANPQQAQTMASPSNSVNYTLQILAGCNTAEIRSLSLTVNPNSIQINQNNDTLVYNGWATSYQWFENGQAIMGATDSFWVMTDTGTYHLETVDSNSCNEISNFINYNNPLLSTYQIGNEQIQLYPNPNNGTFELKLKDIGEANIQIFNAAGQEVYQTMSTNTLINVNLQQLPAAAYWVKVISKTNVYILPFIKQ